MPNIFLSVLTCIKSKCSCGPKIRLAEGVTVVVKMIGVVLRTSTVSQTRKPKKSSQRRKVLMGWQRERTPENESRQRSKLKEAMRKKGPRNFGAFSKFFVIDIAPKLKGILIPLG